MPKHVHQKACFSRIMAIKEIMLLFIKVHKTNEWSESIIFNNRRSSTRYWIKVSKSQAESRRPRHSHKVYQHTPRFVNCNTVYFIVLQCLSRQLALWFYIALVSSQSHVSLCTYSSGLLVSWNNTVNRLIVIVVTYCTQPKYIFLIR